MRVLKTKQVVLAIMATLFLVPVLVACGATTTPVPKAKQAVTLSLSYIPDVQFAPYYVAQDKGYFAAEGLEVTMQYGSINDLMSLVAQGKIPFALVSGDELIQARANGIPVQMIATQYQKYPVALAALKSKNINSLADIKGKTIGIPGAFGSTYIGLKALLASAKLTESDINLQTIGFTQREALAQGKVDAAMVYSMNEPVALKADGVDINLFEVSANSNLASIGLMAGESLISSNPDLVQRMVRAVQHGIKDTIANPDAAFESTIKVAPDAKSTNPEQRKQVLRETAKYMVNETVKGQPFGFNDAKIWEKTEQFLFDNKLTRTRTDASKGFLNKYLSTEFGNYS